jgi:radical SAM protein with 4Fe4S-binding SPASM domain
VDRWVASIDQGSVLGIVPFLGIVKRLLWGGQGLPCGAGSEAVTVTTDGQIMACPVSSEFAWNEMGNFTDIKPVYVGEPCISCDIYHLCGGRCLFTYKERLWGTEGFEALCDLTHQLVDQLVAAQEVVKGALPELQAELFYPPFNNTTEIIP